MRRVEIQTGTKKRVLYIEDGLARRRLGRLAEKIAAQERRLAFEYGTEDVAHGFVKGRNCVTMAQAHVGFDFTVSMDIKDWFESVTFQQLLNAGLSTERSEKCCVEHRIRQGLPTSPACANLVAVHLDTKIMVHYGRGYPSSVYTRYADDLCISAMYGWSALSPDLVIERIRIAVASMGWSINERKTSVQWAFRGRRIICGLSVGETDVRIPNRTRKLLRACAHNDASSAQTRGLAEWCKVKEPGQKKLKQPFSRHLNTED